MVRRQFGEGTKLLHIVGASCLNLFQARWEFCSGVSPCLHSSHALQKAWRKSNDHERQQRREERQINIKRSGIYRQGTRAGCTPPWRHPGSQQTVVTDAVLADFRGKGNGYRHHGHQHSSWGFLFLLLGMVGEVDQEIPWLRGTTDGEGIKNPPNKKSGRCQERGHSLAQLMCVDGWVPGWHRMVRAFCKSCCQHRLLPGVAPDLHFLWAMESARSTRWPTGIPNFFQCKRSHRMCLGKLYRQENRERSSRRSKHFHSMI